MRYWAKAPMRRDQSVLFAPTLDDWIGEDHPVRLFDEILSACEWSSWESRYCGVMGQPPIHPRMLASAILYGLTLGIRSSRALERACGNSLDFMWLVEGRQIDHSTFCNFRNEFHGELKELFGQIGRIGIKMGLVSLNRVSLDGTRVRANSSRHGSATAQRLQERLAGLDEQIERLFAEAEQADQKEAHSYGDQTPNALPKELSNTQRRREVLQRALDEARARDQERRRCPDVRQEPVRVPVTDPESRVMPNKEGGHAPNYTPLAAVDAEAGLIVDAEVIAHVNEAAETVRTVQRIEERFDQKPKELLADKHHGTGKNLAELEAEAVKAFIPLQDRYDTQDNPARRQDPGQPVAEEQLQRLPRRPGGKLDKSAFIYDAQDDVYWCPMGRKLVYWHTRKIQRVGWTAHQRKYRSMDCSNCPLASQCLGGGAKVRTVGRDEHEVKREAMMQRLATAQGREACQMRKCLSEVAFAIIKSIMGLRQFLVRGLRKVKTEWLWACTAYNLKRLMSEIRVRGLELGCAAR